MISITVNGLEGVQGLLKWLDPDERKAELIKDIEVECMAFKRFVELDPAVPQDYVNSLIIATLPEFDGVFMHIYVPDMWKDRKFGTRFEWALYTCSKRKYQGGGLSPEYKGKDWMIEKWRQYKPIFISNIKEKFRTSLSEA